MRAPNWRSRPLPDSASLPVETTALARALIGWRLVRRTRAGMSAGRIVETEAYPPGDPASHAFRGPRPRNAVMFGPPHRAYVYHIYGRYWCFNVTSEEDGRGAGVLIRALEPLEGVALMRRRRGLEDPRALCSGPGRLTQAFEIDRSLDGIDLLRDSTLALVPPDRPPAAIGRSRRIGISVAAHRLLRFYERGSAYLSGPKRLSP
ncbi:MAG TPA: DNA-3-methyladenine glycosylase [Candidatus Acidoferrales bacterium]|nr:DNA-3-methyladenine glycosylase [Candidatus Acidoferrales bacterium]